LDPIACLRDCRDALDCAVPDYDFAAECLANYFEWRARGGFEPDGGDALASILDLRLRAAPNRD
jgi:hypothetical protein